MLKVTLSVEDTACFEAMGQFCGDFSGQVTVGVAREGEQFFLVVQATDAFYICFAEQKFPLQPVGETDTWVPDIWVPDTKVSVAKVCCSSEKLFNRLTDLLASAYPRRRKKSKRTDSRTSARIFIVPDETIEIDLVEQDSKLSSRASCGSSVCVQVARAAGAPPRTDHPHPIEQEPLYVEPVWDTGYLGARRPDVSFTLPCSVAYEMLAFATVVGTCITFEKGDDQITMTAREEKDAVTLTHTLSPPDLATCCTSAHRPKREKMSAYAEGKRQSSPSWATCEASDAWPESSVLQEGLPVALAVLPQKSGDRHPKPKHQETEPGFPSKYLCLLHRAPVRGHIQFKVFYEGGEPRALEVTDASQEASNFHFVVFVPPPLPCN